MKILFILANSTFPPKEGAHAQTLGMIRTISEMGHSCHLLVGTKDIVDFNAEAFACFAPKVELLCLGIQESTYSGSLLRNIATRVLLDFVPKFLSDLLIERIRLCDVKFVQFAREHSSKFNVIHLEGIQLAPFAALIRKGKILMSIVDAWSLRQKRLLTIAKSESGRISRSLSFAISIVNDKLFLKHLPYVHVVSPSDANYLHHEGIPGAISIPISLDKRSLISANSPQIKVEVLIYGDLRIPYIKDGVIKFFRTFLSFDNALASTSKLIVLGRTEPDIELQRIAQKNKNITFLNWVEDPFLLQSSSKLIVLPDESGTGLKNRAISALASGAVVLGTEAAFEGIPVIPGHQAIVGSVELLAEKSLEILNFPDLYQSVGIAGRKFALEHYSSYKVAQSWISLYSNLSEPLEKLE